MSGVGRLVHIGVGRTDAGGQLVGANAGRPVVESVRRAEPRRGAAGGRDAAGAGPPLERRPLRFRQPFQQSLPR